MKFASPCIASLVLAAGGAPSAAPVTEHRSFTDSYDVGAVAPRLEVSNIWGSVTVSAGQAGRITVAVTERRSAPDRALFERSLDVMGLDVAADAAGVSIIVGAREQQWRRPNDCRGCRVDYQFEIQVPPDAEVDVGTVMDGRVQIRGVAGTVSATNVNGPIGIDNLRDCARINSVNGAVTMRFERAPRSDCRIETINGDITIDVLAGTGLDLALDLFNGDVSTELPVSPFSLPATVEQVVEDGRSRYRVQQLAGMRLGAGGPVYSIATMNGDLRIRKQP